MRYLLAAAAAALAGCSTVPAPTPIAIPAAASVKQGAIPAFGRIVDLTAEPAATVYRVKLPDGSQRSVRSAQPFPMGACVEVAGETSISESRSCR